MKEYITLGSTPAEEDCAQVGSEEYVRRAKDECRRFINLIIEKCGEPPEKASLMFKSFPHDFGTYYEVVCYYESDDKDSISYALHCESHGPIKWDGEGAEVWKK